MPEIGETKSGYKIGRKSGNRWIWTACTDCGKERWVMLLGGKPINLRCNQCAAQLRRGEKNPAWKGGRRIDKQSGYIILTLQPSDPFYCMTGNNNSVFEHRYVMAQYLGRPLTDKEIVHHRGIMYPIASRENKADNRIENLKLYSSQAGHAQSTWERISELEKVNKELQGRVTMLEAEIVLIHSEQSNLSLPGSGFNGR